MTRTDDCQDCKGGGLVPGSGCTCDGDAQHLYTYDLHCVPGQRRARCVPDRKVISGQSRSATGTANRPLPAATQVIELAERSLQAGSRFGPVQQRPLTATGLHFHQQPPLAATAANGSAPPRRTHRLTPPPAAAATCDGSKRPSAATSSGRRGQRGFSERGTY